MKLPIRNERIRKFAELVFLKAKYATTSLIATGLDVSVFMALVKGAAMNSVPAQAISYFCGMLLNFFLQKRFIFTLQRKATTVFLLAMSVSLGGLLLSTGLIYFFDRIPFLHAHPLLLKLTVTGLIFFYNFYLKRFAFEKRFI